jgi:adenylate cyclase
MWHVWRAVRRVRSVCRPSTRLPAVAQEPDFVCDVRGVIAARRDEDVSGVLFADLRGFTARTEVTDSQAMAALLRRFYGCAERVLFPEAIIDKVVGDEVMALYLPDIQRRITREQVPRLMVDHALELLRAVGYDSPSGPFVEMGVGLDMGEAFVGNIGERAVYDFTAIGDVVNTAARLQGKARGGEVLLSERVASGLPAAIGTPVELELKGKRNIERAYRVAL